MCGILGQINFHEAIHKLPALSMLGHRGPDGFGEWTNDTNRVYLGQTRLAILDLSENGRQPMEDSSGRYVITFNGEIYNHLELRKLLPEKAWRGTSDTETLLELLAVKGLEIIKLLKGMFAFALYDDQDGSLVLVRDRLGIKPLWYKLSDDTLTFSSEVRPMLNGNNKLTNSALSEYIGFGHLPIKGEVFKDLYSLSPGSLLKVTSNGKMDEKQWWPNGSFKKSTPSSDKDCIDTIKKLVTTSIEEHLISDVEVGAFLSGGIDSSIIVLTAGKILGKNLKTYTIGFPNAGFDERKIAEIVAKKAGTEHNVLEVNEGSCIKWVQEAVDKLDLPSVDAINSYIVSKAVSETGLKVALSGLGGDELFGGYPSFNDVPKLQWLSAMPKPLRDCVIKMLPEKIKEKLEGLQSFSIEDLTTARRRFASIKKLKSLGLDGGDPSMQDTPKGLDTMGAISWAEIQGYMIPMLLRDSDQMSMAVGLELRVPFLDHELVEYALSLPQRFKKGAGVKPLLINAFKDELPAEVYNRPKQGFELPMKLWMNGPLDEYTQSGIKAASAILNQQEPLSIYEKFQNGQVHWTRPWNWCVLGKWLQKNA